jgi:hypothetical protein
MQKMQKKISRDFFLECNICKLYVGCVLDVFVLAVLVTFQNFCFLL